MYEIAKQKIQDALNAFSTELPCIDKPEMCEVYEIFKMGTQDSYPESIPDTPGVNCYISPNKVEYIGMTINSLRIELAKYDQWAREKELTIISIPVNRYYIAPALEAFMIKTIQPLENKRGKKL